MGLSTALSAALTGLRVTQTGIELVSSNVANAETDGYTRKTTSQTPIIVGERAIGVRVDQVQRSLDQYVQRQLRTETSGLTYAELKAGYLDRAQQLFGTPGSETSLDSLMNNFTSAIDQLVTSPEAQTNRAQVLSEAGVLTQSLNTISTEIQSMRQEADIGLQDTVTRINEALKGLVNAGVQIANSKDPQSPPPDLLDLRDKYLGQLSELMDIKVTPGGTGDINVFTSSGVQLYGNRQAGTLRFDGGGAITPEALYSTDPSKRSIGTVLLRDPSGTEVDLLGPGGVRSGRMKAFADVRDTILPQAQTQIDELADGMARALGTRTIDGTAVTAGAANGFDLDLATMQPGDNFKITFTRTPPGTQQTISFFRVDQAGTLPLSNNLTPDPNDTVVGINFSGGYASVATQIATALGAGFTVSNTGSTLRVLDDGAAGTIDIASMQSKVTATALTGQGTALPFFVDAGRANAVYTGTLDGTPQRIGFAQRITINPALLQDPGRLVVYNTSPATPPGDPTRPTAMRDALNNVTTQFRTDTGIGGVSTPFQGSIGDFARQIIDTQARQSEVAQRVYEGQQVVVTTLSDRFADSSAVDVDQEMGRLIELQNSYAANARIITVVKEMFDLLLQSGL